MALTAIQARQMARDQGLNASDPAVIRSLMAASEQGTIGAPTPGGSLPPPSSGSPVIDLIRGGIIDPLRQQLGPYTGGPGFSGSFVSDALGGLQRFGQRLKTGEGIGLGPEGIPGFMLPSGEEPKEAVAPPPPERPAGKGKSFADTLSDMMRTQLGSTPLPPDRPPPQMQIPGMPDFSAARQAMAGAAPQAPERAGRGEQMSRWLGAMAGGAGQGLQQMNLASVLTGAGAAGARELGDIADQARRAEQLFQTQRSRHGRARALIEVSISEKSAAAERARAQAMFRNDLVRYSHQRERDKLLAGGVQISGNNFIMKIPDLENDRMNYEAINMDQVGTLMEMMKIQAAHAVGANRGKLQAGTYEIAMSMFKDAPHMVVPATLAALLVSGVIGGDLRTLYEQKVGAKLTEVGRDPKVMEDMIGTREYTEFMDKTMFGIAIQDITAPGGDAIFQQLFGEAFRGMPSFVAPEE